MADKKKGLQPHKLDAEMDILTVSGLESKEDLAFRKLPNGAVERPPLTWAEMGFIIRKTAE